MIPNAWKLWPGVVATACLAAVAPASADVVPMYQMYSNGQTDFFYTTDAAERAYALAYYGYSDRGVPFYIDDGLVRDMGTAFWQRFYKGPPQLEHFYTWTQPDIDYVQANGWVYEGAAGVVKTGPGYAGTTALYRYNKWNPATYDLQHYYTTNWMDSLQPWMAGWGSDGVVAYVWTAPQVWDYAARFIGYSYPSIMETTLPYQVSVTMRNVGHKTWRVGDRIYLKLASDTPYWCVQNQRNWAGNLMYDRVNIAYDTVPGQDHVFTFTVMPGGCLGGPAGFQWRMMGESVSFRSEDSPIASISLIPPRVQFISQAVPAGQLTGKTYRAQVTMRNASPTDTWSSGYALVAEPAVGGTWGSSRIAVAATVGPGQSYTFDWNFVAPVAGTYNFQWHMVNKYGQTIGQITPLIKVSVAASASDFLPSSPPPSTAPPVGSMPYYPPF